MNQIECTICGAISQMPVERCNVCSSVISPNQNSFSNLPPLEFTSNYAPNPLPKSSNDALHQQVLEGVTNCPDCGAIIPLYEQRCLKCSLAFEKAKPPFYAKLYSPTFVTIFIAFLFACGLIYYFMPHNPQTPLDILSRQASVTGIDDSIVYKNYVLKGKGVFIHHRWNEPDIPQEISFSFVHEKPNKISLEYNSGNFDDTNFNAQQFYLKRVFTGDVGKEYMYFGKGHWNYYLTSDDVANSEFLLEPPKYLKTENKDIKCPPGDQYISCAPRAYSIDSESVVVEPKDFEFIAGDYAFGHKKYGTTLMLFDKNKGFLMSQIRKTRFNKTDVVSIIYYKKYKRFSAPHKSFSGNIENTNIYFPSEIEINYSGDGGFDFKLKLAVNSLEFDQTIDKETYKTPQ